MGCWHGGYHGCGPWHGWGYGPGWYDPADWAEEADWPIRRRYRRYRRVERETDTDELEARLADLREEVRRAEAELVRVRGGDTAAEKS
jgi:hypothetical protein